MTGAPDFVGIATLITAIGGVMVGIIAAITNAVMTIRNRDAIREVQHNTNSKMDELVSTVRSDSTAKGNLQGRAELKQEQKNERNTK